MVLHSLILVLIQLGNLWKNIRLKIKDTNTYIMDRQESALRLRSSLFLHSITDYRNLQLPKNMLLMMLIKIYYIDNLYQIVKIMVALVLEKWRAGRFILQARQPSCKRSSLNIQILIILKHVKTVEC